MTALNTDSDKMVLLPEDLKLPQYGSSRLLSYSDKDSPLVNLQFMWFDIIDYGNFYLSLFVIKSYDQLYILDTINNLDN